MTGATVGRVLEGVDPHGSICTDEIFGPLAPIVPFAEGIEDYLDVKYTCVDR